MNDRPIYLDYMATTPVDPKVMHAMMDCLSIEGNFGNPSSSSHIYGWQAEEAVITARAQVASLVGASPRTIVFTSGATESNNLAIKGAATFYQDNGKHIITMTTEHKAVIDVCEELSSQGFDITYLNPQPNGLLDLDELKAAIRPDTILISIMHVNNEIGVVQDIQVIGEIARAHGVLFHCDAAQSVGKLDINLSKLPVDFMSFSAHKLYGPKGVGALYVCRQPRRHLSAQIHGGGHEFGFRSGTLATHQLVGMGMAFHLAKEYSQKDKQHIAKLSKRLLDGILALGNVSLNGSSLHRFSGNLNLCFHDIDGEALMLSLKGLAFSSGSACNSASLQVSHVLTAIGLSNLDANSSLRLCVGRYTTEREVDQAVIAIGEQVMRLRSFLPS
jgi:cysteine desulfurase